MYLLGENVTFDFVTHDPFTGAVTDADATPTANIFIEDNDVPIVSPLVVKRTGKTGDYRVSFPLSVASGFVVEKSFSLVASATVGGISAKSVVANFTIDRGNAPIPSDESEFLVII